METDRNKGKKEEGKASEQVVIRFTKKEKKAFEERAKKAGLSLSEFARQSIFSTGRKGVDIDILMELRRAAGFCKTALEEHDSAEVASAFQALQTVAIQMVKGI